MGSKQKRRLLGLIIVIFICMASLSTPFQHYASFPNELRLFTGEKKQLHLSMPVSANITLSNPNIIEVNGQSKPSFKLNLDRPISVKSEVSGSTDMTFKLFGSIPLKTLRVNVVPDLKVVPGGQTIGVKIKSAGILVVGHHLVPISDHHKISPGEEAGLRIGDLIVKMNGVPIRDVSKVAAFVNEAGKTKKPIELEIIRTGKTIKTVIKPAYDQADSMYRLGLYIRDSAAGVGTLTFYSQEHGVYGALGHIISDMDTGTPIIAGGGEIVHSNVTSISKSQHGEPGEKKAHFFREDKMLGTIQKNTNFGIFGELRETPKSGMINEPVSIAFSEEVKPGPAQILTVVNGQKVEKFDIEIVHVNKQTMPQTKGMVIRITDERLLKRTGGIVQGMSGSPILQDGKLVGAVTHVFVNDPASGYGCFIEWMLQDAGILIAPQKEKNLKAS